MPLHLIPTTKRGHIYFLNNNNNNNNNNYYYYYLKTSPFDNLKPLTKIIFKKKKGKMVGRGTKVKCNNQPMKLKSNMNEMKKIGDEVKERLSE